MVPALAPPNQRVILTSGFHIRSFGGIDSKVVQNIDDVLKNHLQSTIHVDISVLNVLNVLDECVDVGLDGRDLFVGQSELRSQSVDQSVKGSLQFRQQSVEGSGRLVG